MAERHAHGSPRRWRSAAGRRLGDLTALALPRRRRVALENLAQAFPDLSADERRRLARQSWQHIGMTIVELARLLARPLQATLDEMTMDGREHIQRAMAEHGRALMLTAHLGNWEYLAPRPTSPATRARSSSDRSTRPCYRSGRHHAPQDRGRDHRQARSPAPGAGRASPGRMIGILLDQNASRREGAFVPFFGRAASTSRSIALLALRTRTPIVPVFIRREGPGRHRVVVEPHVPMPDAANDFEGAVVELTARCTAVIERVVRQTPGQWLWAHDRWRTRPPTGAPR